MLGSMSIIQTILTQKGSSPSKSESDLFGCAHGASRVSELEMTSKASRLAAA